MIACTRGAKKLSKFCDEKQGRKSRRALLRLFHDPLIGGSSGGVAASRLSTRLRVCCPKRESSGNSSKIQTIGQPSPNSCDGSTAFAQPCLRVIANQGKREFTSAVVEVKVGIFEPQLALDAGSSIISTSNQARKQSLRSLVRNSKHTSSSRGLFFCRRRLLI